MTAEHAHALDTGGEVEALAEAICAARHADEQALITRNPDAESPRFRAAAHFDCFRLAEEMSGHRFADLLTAVQTAADTVLAEARRLCCGENPSAHHAATHDHSQRMAFAEELARAVRGS